MKPIDDKLIELARRSGIHHCQATLLLQRIREVVKRDGEVQVQNFGTFYLRKFKPTTRVLNGVTYELPARECIGLRNCDVDDESSDVEPTGPIDEPSTNFDQLPISFEAFPGETVQVDWQHQGDGLLSVFVGDRSPATSNVFIDPSAEFGGRDGIRIVRCWVRNATGQFADEKFRQLLLSSTGEVLTDGGRRPVDSNDPILESWFELDVNDQSVSISVDAPVNGVGDRTLQFLFLWDVPGEEGSALT